MGGRGRTNLVVEQVSHHPPITAYHISNESKGLVLNGHSAQKTSFSGKLFFVLGLLICAAAADQCVFESIESTVLPRRTGGSIIVKQIGHATLTVDLPDGQKEEYLITLPRLRIDGLWYGSPYIELTESSYIQSSTGWLSTVRILCPCPSSCLTDK